MYALREITLCHYVTLLVSCYEQLVYVAEETAYAVLTRIKRTQYETQFGHDYGRW